jgi:hypothetical protein
MPRYLLGILIFKELTMRHLYKSFSVRGLRFDVLTTVSINVIFLWDVMCCVVDRYSTNVIAGFHHSVNKICAVLGFYSTKV